LYLLKYISAKFSSQILLVSFDKDSQLYHESEAYHKLKPFESKRHDRQVENMISHKLIAKLTKRSDIPAYLKDEFGKPHLRDDHRHISISHSNNMACAIISDVSVGIDVQVHTQKLASIKEKFVSEEKLKVIDQAHQIESLHILWGAKEAMYKAYGKKQLRFKTDLLVQTFKYANKMGHTYGWVSKNQEKERYSIYYEKINDNYLVFAIADPEL